MDAEKHFLIPGVTSANQARILDSIYFLNKILYLDSLVLKMILLKIEGNLLLLLFLELKLNIKQSTTKNSSVLIHNLYKEKLIKKKKVNLKMRKNE